MKRNTNLSDVLFLVELRPVAYLPSIGEAGSEEAFALAPEPGELESIGQYKAVVRVDSWYDQNSRFVFTNSKDIPGVSCPCNTDNKKDGPISAGMTSRTRCNPAKQSSAPSQTRLSPPNATASCTLRRCERSWIP